MIVLGLNPVKQLSVSQSDFHGMMQFVVKLGLEVSELVIFQMDRAACACPANFWWMEKDRPAEWRGPPPSSGFPVSTSLNFFGPTDTISNAGKKKIQGIR